MNPTNLTTLTDGDRIAVEYEPVRARGSSRTLETRVVENGLTPDDDAMYLAEYHSENDRYPRRRLVEREDGWTLEARRSTEDGTRWAAYSVVGSASVERAFRRAVRAAPTAD